jgi:hypothetical protein
MTVYTRKQATVITNVNWGTSDLFFSKQVWRQPYQRAKHVGRKQMIINFTTCMHVTDSVLLWHYALGCNASDLHTIQAKGTMFLQNVWNQLTSGAASHPRRKESRNIYYTKCIKVYNITTAHKLRSLYKQLRHSDWLYNNQTLYN